MGCFPPCLPQPYRTEPELLCTWETLSTRDKDSDRGEIRRRLPVGSIQPPALRQAGEAAVHQSQSPSGPQLISSCGTDEPDGHQGFAQG